MSVSCAGPHDLPTNYSPVSKFTPPSYRQTGNTAIIFSPTQEQHSHIYIYIYKMGQLQSQGNSMAPLIFSHNLIYALNFPPHPPVVRQLSILEDKPPALVAL